jgi:thiol-disulfide isomerase/thioredoxin
MPIETRIALLVTLVALAVSAGFYYRFTSGRSKRVAGGEQIDLKLLAATKDGKPVTRFGKKVTFLQFSSEFCSQCVTTARTFRDLEEQSEDILHIEVDVTHRLDLAKKFSILQTPTTLVLDGHGRITSRISGAARPQSIKDEIGMFEI